DDALVGKLLEERLSRPDCRDGYTLDGYPRNLAQARSLEHLDGARTEVVFLIETREDVVIRRLATRRVCSSCGAIYNVITRKPAREGVCDVCGATLVQRTDDRPDVIQERMRTYHAKTEPLIAHYQEKGVLHRVEGNGTVEETFRPVRDILDGELRRAKESQARP
ncbi:MAG TPA: nucleoside monophosphate kinase, partial [Burkholderiales bacterium]|nr:nucleoside monophosphate kinase [Burkholderiales bacterium]